MIGEQMDNPGSKYDVFLSFRGEIRKGFTDHFYLRLKDYEFNVFLDEDELPRGDPITEKLKQAIKESRLAVIMFSKGYAESRWCLEELVEIMECRRTKGQFVFPIFYDVDPSDVRHQTGSFATAFQNHEQRFTEEKVREWRKALTAAAELSGEHFQVNNGREARFIRKVVEQIAIKLQNGCLNVATNPVGIDSRLQKFSNYLDVGGSNVVRIIGIWGMGGLGKSTIAKAIFNTYQHRFDGACFLENVGNEKLVDLQNMLLSKILRSANINVSTVDEGTEKIKTRLGNVRVLVIIDDVDSVAQINALAIKRDSFGPGSRIVITTRDQNLLKTPEVVDEACSLPTMDNEEALELLSWHAFGKSSPNEGYRKVSREAVDYCGGLPLALEAVGSYLCTKTTSEWTDALKKWKRVQPSITHKIFKVSYDGLTDDKVKDIFLDISCFFIGMNKHHVLAILDGCDSNPAIGIKELEERCLVTVDPEGNLMMHCLIRDTGREIVRAKSPKKLESRCRLWHHEDVKHVLAKKCEKKKIEGIALDFLEPDKLSVSTEAFRKMLNLRLLKIRGVKFTGDCKHLPEELRWLSLSDFPLQAIPEDFNQPNVVDIDLSYSNIKVWNDNVSLEKLKFLNLGYCDHLKQSPDFSRIPNIEILILKACKRLSKIHHSVVKLKNLKYLSVAKCKNLQEIPDLPTNLEILKANECIALKKMPDFSEMLSMVELHLNHSPKLTKILGLHKSLNTMRRIHMEGCTNLTAAFRKAILQGWGVSRNGDLFCPGNDLLSGFTCVDPKDEIVSSLFIPGNDLPSGFTYFDPKEEIVVPQCFGDDAKALTLCIVYSCDDSQSSDSLCIRVENRTKETEISSCPMYATVLNSHESYIWLGRLSNNTLNVNGGDKINVGAHFVGHGSTDDIHIRVQKIGVYLEQENVVDEFSNPMTLSSEYDKEANLMQDKVRLLSEENLSRKRQRYDKDVNLMQDQVRLSSEENGSRKRRGYDKDVNLTQDEVRLSYEENRSRKRLRSNGVERNAQEIDAPINSCMD
ncbi:disease resistance protein RPV1 [Pyrus x bretschneideri]|uniref:disease resistance protein RPV1 n=1 Tax=Pyrus x bretschneideri TaxID=225117 RepID=UPI00202DE73F|nr:disease resistance protein RPV1 [Pyrus x bretschneideri]